MAVREKSIWILIIFILSGLVLGGLIGELTSGINWLWWLSYGQSFGIDTPLVLNLNVITVTFALTMKINIASIIGMALGIFIYRKI